MSDEPRFCVNGHDEIHRRIRQIERRRLSLESQLAANEREYREIQESDDLLVSEHNQLVARLSALDAA